MCVDTPHEKTITFPTPCLSQGIAQSWRGKKLCHLLLLEVALWSVQRDFLEGALGFEEAEGQWRGDGCFCSELVPPPWLVLVLSDAKWDIPLQVIPPGTKHKLNRYQRGFRTHWRTSPSSLKKVNWIWIVRGFGDQLGFFM